MTGVQTCALPIWQKLSYRPLKPDAPVLKLRHSGVAKRCQRIALGVSPRKGVNHDRLSREAAAEASIPQSAAASRLKRLPVVANLGLTPKAICCHCSQFKERNFKTRERGLFTTNNTNPHESNTKKQLPTTFDPLEAQQSVSWSVIETVLIRADS